MPTRVSLYKDTDIPKSWPGFAVLAEQLNYGIFPPQFGWFEEWRHSVASATQDVISGKQTPEDAIKFLTDEAVRLKAK
jgi:ABC-type glycerol-3-phosphate transport system substrate-binding protein